MFPCRAGIQIPSVEVRFQNLHVECNIVVGDRGLPTVMNSYRTFIEVSQNLLTEQICFSAGFCREKESLAAL